MTDNKPTSLDDLHRAIDPAYDFRLAAYHLSEATRHMQHVFLTAFGEFTRAAQRFEKAYVAITQKPAVKDEIGTCGCGARDDEECRGEPGDCEW